MQKLAFYQGLVYCQTPKFDDFLVKDVMTLGRNLQLKHYFSKQEPVKQTKNMTHP